MQCGGALFDYGGECVCDIVGNGRWHQLNMYSQGPGRALDLLQHAGHCSIAVCSRMPEDSHARELRHYLTEQLQPLGNQLRAKKGCARHVPARPRQTRHQFVFDRIGHAYCDDGNQAGRLLCRAGGRRALRHNEVNLTLNQFSSRLGEVDPDSILHNGAQR